ncbi:hypothetical protein [Vulgatibacter sp.]|uniref:hypothetical protein n=1 Tax=Vulgatibacter sp. TaxID=1971226 RepID=UPI0035674F98
MKKAPLLAALVGIAALGYGATRLHAGGARAAWVGEDDLPAGLLEGLGSEQRDVVLAAMNATPCACGAGSCAACMVEDAAAPQSARAFAQAIQLAKLGGTSDQIRSAIARAPTSATVPAPGRRLRGDGAAHDHVHGDGEDIGVGSHHAGNN